MSSQGDPEYVAHRVAEVPHWHHRVEVAPGIITPGVQNTEGLLEQVGLPEDCTGMRVLDIGARDGFFSFEVERRGAAEIVSLDNVPPEKTGFAVAAELLGSKAEYVTDNVYNVSVERYGKFDLVLFFGVLYHLRHPLLALDHIWDICNHGAQLYVESHMIDEGLVLHDGSFNRLDSYHADLLALPLVQFYPGRMLGNDFTSTWAPNQVALRGLLESAGFDVQHEWLGAFRGGAIAVARELDPEGQRAADAAAAWDLAHNQILKTSAYSPPASS